MALTKSRTDLNNGTTLTAGAGDTTGSTIDISASYATVVFIQLVNGATGPTVAAQVQIQVTADTGATRWENYGGPLVGSTTNSITASWAVEMPISVQAFRLVAGSNTGQNVTLNADYSRVTAL